MLINTQNSELKSILIIDNKSAIRNMIYGQLNEQYQCLVAENGKIGFDTARQFVPDLIIGDIFMGAINGWQLNLLLKNDELTSHIPTLLHFAKLNV